MHLKKATMTISERFLLEDTKDQDKTDLNRLQKFLICVGKETSASEICIQATRESWRKDTQTLRVWASRN